MQSPHTVRQKENVFYLVRTAAFCCQPLDGPLCCRKMCTIGPRFFQLVTNSTESSMSALHSLYALPAMSHLYTQIHMVFCWFIWTPQLATWIKKAVHKPRDQSPYAFHYRFLGRGSCSRSYILLFFFKSLIFIPLLNT